MRREKMRLTEKKTEPCLKTDVKLGGRYRIANVMGIGGFGITYAAFDVKNGSPAAVKEYFPDGIAVRKGKRVCLSSEENAEIYRGGLIKFYREGEYSSQFNGNPNIVSVYDRFYENGTAYIVMEYLSGITLESYVKKHGVLSEGQTAYLAEKLSSALIIIHSAELLHRDVSPDNIMLCEDKIKLIDFGSARSVSDESPQMLTVFMKTGFTPAEQYIQNGNYGGWTDIYSLGAVMYFALTGKKPRPPWVRMMDDGELSEGLKETSSPLCGIIRRAMSISESERYKSAVDMKADIVGLKIKTEPVFVPTEDLAEPPNYKSVLSKRRKRIFAVSAAVLAAAAALFFGTGALLGDKLSDMPVTLSFNAEYSGDFKYEGAIPTRRLEKFGGDVKVTLKYDIADKTNRATGFVPTDEEGRKMVEYLSTELYPWSEENGWICADPVSGEYSFVISREGIENIHGGSFGFETYNIIIKSITLEKGESEGKYFLRDYSEYNENYLTEEKVGKKTVTVDIGDKMFYDVEVPVNRSSIPKAAFLEFEGDVLMTLQIERVGTENSMMLHIWNNGGLWEILNGRIYAVEEVDRKNAVTLVTMRKDGWIDLNGGLKECSVVVTKEAVDRMSDGIFFQGYSVSVKSARLESCEE